jgi:pantoate kinase
VIGATGGGYILSRGTVTRATPRARGGVTTRVNGDGSYDARTTRTAVTLLLSDVGKEGASIHLDQRVETPIGSGFGASAVASTLGLRLTKKELAGHAHRAEIIEQTGVGTVSVIYDSVGAGAITKPGPPGAAEFEAVKVPRGTNIVTAYFAPYDKKDALSSPKMTQKINRLGRESLSRFLTDPSLDSLAAEGESFSSKLGLETPELRKAIRVAKAAGASHASQNMIGYSVHCLTDQDALPKVSRALGGLGSSARVDAFEVGRVRAGALKLSRL